MKIIHNLLVVCVILIITTAIFMWLGYFVQGNLNTKEWPIDYKTQFSVLYLLSLVVVTGIYKLTE